MPPRLPKAVDVEDDPELDEALDPDAPGAPDEGDDSSRGELPEVADGPEGEADLVPGDVEDES